MHCDRIPILMYHGIETPRTASGLRWHLPFAAFEQQMCYLHQAGFKTVDLAETLAVLLGKQARFSVARPVLLTFDDALQSQFDLALPVLEKLGFRATLFVPTAFILTDSGDSARRFEGLGTHTFMRWDQLMHLQASGWDVGSHGHEHLHLGRVSESAAAKDLIQSKAILAQKLGTQIKALAFPFGGYDRNALHLVQKLGFQAGFSTHDGLASPRCDLRRLPRIEVGQNVGLDAYKRMLHRGHVSGFAEKKAWIRDAFGTVHW